MPWCPNCKMEYAYDETVCADCNIPLVDECPTESTMVSFLETDKELHAKKFVKFLKYSNIDEAVYEFDKAKELFVVYVNDESMKQVKKLYKAFYSVESEQIISTLDVEVNSGKSLDELLATKSSPNLDDDNVSGKEDDTSYEYLDEETNLETSYYDDEEEDINSMFDKDELKDIYNNRTKKIDKPTTYIKKEEQYKDLMSSAVTFLLVSIVGIIVLILNIMGILEIFYGLIPLVVMGALFLSFLLIGISSLKKAKVTKGQIGDENRVTTMINDWLVENVSLDQLNGLTSNANSDGERFYQKIGIMKDMVNKQFGELDDSYIEHLLEEFYNNTLDIE